MKLNILICISVLALMLTACASTQTTTTAYPSVPSAPQTQPTQTTADSSAAQTTSAAPVKTVHIDSFSWGFTQDPVTINKGDNVHLVITSSSGTHGVMIPGLGVSSGAVSPGETQTVDFVASEAGTFDYFCNVPCGEGHRSMRGQLVINP